jgi:putative ABC transport system permease protein
MRDKSRSLLPVIVVSLGVFLTVLMSGWMKGVFSDVIDMNAKYTTGHVKIMTRAYAENEHQVPNDLALLEVQELMEHLQHDFPNMKWVKRIHFGGLLDVPDELGETRAQGPAIGRAVDLLSPGSEEAERMNITHSIVQGTMPQKAGEVIISHEFAEKFGVQPGDDISIFGSTMYGSMVVPTFKVSGTLNFGSAILDRGAIIMDIQDAEMAFDMQDAAGEILGFFSEGTYDDELAERVKATFNKSYDNPADEFSPQMFKLKDQAGLGQYIDMADSMGALMVFIFVLAMSIVLWNTGLLGGLRRYSEFGVRLALGEEKSHIFRTTIYEAIVIGVLGSVLGTVFGIGAAWYLQENGLDFSSIMNNVTMMMPNVYRAIVTPELFYIGFFLAYWR